LLQCHTVLQNFELMLLTISCCYWNATLEIFSLLFLWSHSFYQSLFFFYHHSHKRKELSFKSSSSAPLESCISSLLPALLTVSFYSSSAGFVYQFCYCSWICLYHCLFDILCKFILMFFFFFFFLFF